MNGSVLHLHSIDDLDQIAFVNGVAEVDVPVELLDALPLVGEDRPDSERLHRLEHSIRTNGYGGAPRIVVQIDSDGRWSIIDGGHRITAARRVAKEFWPNLLSRKVSTLHFVLHERRRFQHDEAS